VKLLESGVVEEVDDAVRAGLIAAESDRVGDDVVGLIEDNKVEDGDEPEEGVVGLFGEDQVDNDVLTEDNGVPEDSVREEDTLLQLPKPGWQPVPQ
jgi:hypothetical protein